MAGMYYLLENAKSVSVELSGVSPEPKRRYVGIAGTDEIDEVLPLLKLKRGLLDELMAGAATVCEQHEGFDVIALNLPGRAREGRLLIYMQPGLLLFIGGGNDAAAMLDGAARQDGAAFDRILSGFFDRITAGDADALEDMETEISNLEDALISSRGKNAVKDIISLRKRLLVRKRYYEQLLNMLDVLLENENDVLDSRSLRYFKIFSGRMDRLYHSVLNLRDYVTQVREAYQAEVDISLNNIMKIFTVITAIFLPLSLIVGWYGMNVQMPEYKWPLGYPMVIALSAVVVVFCLVVFKRKKWF